MWGSARQADVAADPLPLQGAIDGTEIEGGLLRMDAQKFDQITKSLVAGRSRRQIIKGLAGGSLAGIVALVGVRESKAEGVRCNNDNQCRNKCDRDSARCCNGQCVRGCGPNRTLSLQTCECLRVKDGGTFRTGPNFCGA